MKTPSRFARILSGILAFFLMLVLVLDCALVQAMRVTSDRELYLSAGTGLKAQRMEKLTAAIVETADQYHFSPDTLKPILTEDVIRQQEEAVVGWLIDLLHGTASGAVPVWDSTEIEEAIRADEDFRAAVPSSMRKIVARDQAGSAITTALSNVVSPLRMDVLRMGVSMVRSKLDITVIVNRMDQILLLGFGAAFVLCLLIVLLMRRQLSRALYYIGSGLVASALTIGMIVLVVVALNIPAVCAIMSDLAAQLFSCILAQLGITTGLFALGYLVLGSILMLVFRSIGRKTK